MFKNYIRSALRLLRRQKSYAAISIFSLVLGMTCFILLMVYARYELSFDAFHQKSGRIYKVGQVVESWSIRGSNRFDSTSGPLGQAMVREFPEVESAIRIFPTGVPLVHEEKRTLAEGLFADRDFFKMLSFRLIAGNPETALGEPYTIVLSERLAKTMFGTADPMGRVIRHELGREYRVTGVVKDPPRNSNFRFDYLLSFETMGLLRNDLETSWSILNYGTFVLLKPGASPKLLEDKMKTLVDRYHHPKAKDRAYFLLPLKTLHVDTGVNTWMEPSPVDKNNILLLMAIAVLILSVGCFNYINLTTARAATRSKEVGVRKTFGADKRQLIRQFLGEALVFSAAGLLLSLGLARLLLPLFNRITGVALPAGLLTGGATLLGLAGLGLAVGLLAGGYPALVMASMEAKESLQSRIVSRAAGRRIVFRNVLVVVQFLAMFVLLVGAGVIHGQMRYMKNSDIGYGKDDIVAVRLWDKDSRSNLEVVKAELLKNPDIRAAAVSNVPPIRFTEVNDFKVESDFGEKIDLPQVTRYFVDQGYFDLFGMKIVDGRFFTPEVFPDAENEVVLNETAVRLAGLKNPIGKTLTEPGHGDRPLRIVGVVKDFHFQSFKTKIGPLAFFYRPDSPRMLFLKISHQKLAATLSAVEAAMRRFSPDFVFDYTFMDDLYNGLYQEENRLTGLITGFTAVAVLIASIGLVGLIAFVVERKRKEIAIRKVSGATAGRIAALIIRDLFMLIGAAGAIGLPLAYVFTRKWLEGFYYRTSLGPGIFILSTLFVGTLACLCVARLVFRAARENPAVSLKSL
ncbi:MAG: ABC transporter permease [Candidatus Aminicenantes bacterium]|nr:ABC transporter permease [Candidatus Aminicenantes bacterium]